MNYEMDFSNGKLKLKQKRKFENLVKLYDLYNHLNLDW